MSESELESNVRLFNDNLNRVDKWVNGGVNEYYTTLGGIQVPSVQNINAKITYLPQQFDAKLLLKADLAYVNASLTQLSTLASRFYPTKAEAEADIANIAVRQVVQVGENNVNGGLWYKHNQTDTFLTRSEFDPYTQSKSYIDNKFKSLPLLSLSNSNYSVMFLDNNGQLAVGLLLDKNGKPSTYMLNSIFEGLSDNISTRVSEQLGLMGIKLFSTESGASFLVDKNGQLSWWGVDNNGGIPEYTKKCLLDVVKGEQLDIAVTEVKSTYQEGMIKAVSGPNIDCDGDSMTAGAGGNGTTYPKVLNQLITTAGSTAVVRNSGVGGETSPTITARMGGYPFQVRVAGEVIPATVTPVTITLDQINGQTIRPLLQGNGGASGFIGDLAGVKGSIALVKPNGGNTWDNANYYTFTRSVVGTEVIVNRPENFVTDYAKERMGDIKIIWIGQNGPSTERAIQDAKAIIQNMQALQKRYIVISKPTSTDAEDALFFNEFGVYFLPIRKYLVDFGLSDAGITPTAEDIADMAAGRVPSSLCSSPTDKIHWNAQGYTILAQQVFKKLKFLGWI